VNPTAKRTIRAALAASKPSRFAFQDILPAYHSARSPELRTHLADVISQIDTTGFESVAYDEARAAADYDLFVALVFALRRTGTIDAKRLLMELVGESSRSRPEWRAGDVVYLALSDRLSNSDSVWILDVVNTQPLVDEQIGTFGRLLGRLQFTQITESILETMAARAQSDLLRSRLRMLLESGRGQR
jgi:hypothetical protein